MSMELPELTQAEAAVMRALDCARRQSAKGWELRSTITLARLRLAQGRPAEARRLISAIYEQFNEGFGTQDLSEAANVLRELEGR
jgi:predicted ATPase